MNLICMEVIDVQHRKRGEAALTKLAKGARNFLRAFALLDSTEGLGNSIARIILAYLRGVSVRAELMREPLLQP
jgi:hypothetical protein